MDNDLIKELEELKNKLQDATIKKKTCENQIEILKKERESLEKRCKEEFGLSVEELDSTLDSLSEEILKKKNELKTMLGC